VGNTRSSRAQNSSSRQSGRNSRRLPQINSDILMRRSICPALCHSGHPAGDDAFISRADERVFLNYYLLNLPDASLAAVNASRKFLESVQDFQLCAAGFVAPALGGCGLVVASSSLGAAGSCFRVWVSWFVSSNRLISGPFLALLKGAVCFREKVRSYSGGMK